MKRMFSELWAPEDAGAGSGGDAGAGTGAGGAGGKGTQGADTGGANPGATGSDGKPVAQQAQRPAADVNAGWEAEKRAFIADLQKERRARQEVERQVTEHKNALEIERRRVGALTGITPKSEQEVN